MGALDDLPVTRLVADAESGEWWGEAEIFVPGDMLNLMGETDPAAARAQFRDVFRRIYPRATDEQVDGLAAGLLLHRDRLFTQGVLFQGVVSVPPEEADGQAASWQFFAGAVPVTDLPPAVDPMALVGRSLGLAVDAERTYTETFPTAMGQGVGAVTVVDALTTEESEPAPEGSSPGSDESASEREAEQEAGQRAAADLQAQLRRLRREIGVAGLDGLGLAVLLSRDPAQSRALLVIGVAFDYQRVLEMAALATQIAAHSVLREFARAEA